MGNYIPRFLDEGSPVDLELERYHSRHQTFFEGGSGRSASYVGYDYDLPDEKISLGLKTELPCSIDDVRDILEGDPEQVLNERIATLFKKHDRDPLQLASIREEVTKKWMRDQDCLYTYVPEFQKIAKHLSACIASKDASSSFQRSTWFAEKEKYYVVTRILQRITSSDFFKDECTVSPLRFGLYCDPSIKPYLSQDDIDRIEKYLPVSTDETAEWVARMWVKVNKLEKKISGDALEKIIVVLRNPGLCIEDPTLTGRVADIEAEIEQAKKFKKFVDDSPMKKKILKYLSKKLEQSERRKDQQDPAEPPPRIGTEEGDADIVLKRYFSEHHPNIPLSTKLFFYDYAVSLSFRRQVASFCNILFEECDKKRFAVDVEDLLRRNFESEVGVGGWRAYLNDFLETGDLTAPSTLRGYPDALREWRALPKYEVYSRRRIREIVYRSMMYVGSDEDDARRVSHLFFWLDPQLVLHKSGYSSSVLKTLFIEIMGVSKYEDLSRDVQEEFKGFIRVVVGCLQLYSKGKEWNIFAIQRCFSDEFSEQILSLIAPLLHRGMSDDRYRETALRALMISDTNYALVVKNINELQYPVTYVDLLRAVTLPGEDVKVSFARARLLMNNTSFSKPDEPATPIPETVNGIIEELERVLKATQDFRGESTAENLSKLASFDSVKLDTKTSMLSELVFQGQAITSITRHIPPKTFRDLYDKFSEVVRRATAVYRGVQKIQRDIDSSENTIAGLTSAGAEVPRGSAQTTLISLRGDVERKRKEIAQKIITLKDGLESDAGIMDIRLKDLQRTWSEIVGKIPSAAAASPLTPNLIRLADGEVEEKIENALSKLFIVWLSPFGPSPQTTRRASSAGMPPTAPPPEEPPEALSVEISFLKNEIFAIISLLKRLSKKVNPSPHTSQTIDILRDSMFHKGMSQKFCEVLVDTLKEVGARIRDLGLELGLSDADKKDLKESVSSLLEKANVCMARKPVSSSKKKRRREKAPGRKGEETPLDKVVIEHPLVSLMNRYERIRGVARNNIRFVDDFVGILGGAKSGELSRLPKPIEKLVSDYNKENAFTLKIKGHGDYKISTREEGGERNYVLSGRRESNQRLTDAEIQDIGDQYHTFVKILEELIPFIWKARKGCSSFPATIEEIGKIVDPVEIKKLLFESYECSSSDERVVALQTKYLGMPKG